MAVYVVGGCRRGSTSLWAYSRRVAAVEKTSGEENGASPELMGYSAKEWTDAWKKWNADLMPPRWSPPEAPALPAAKNAR